MKKSFLMIFGLFLIGITFKEPVLAASYENVRPINAIGETQLFIDLALEIDTCTDISGNKFNLDPKNALSEEVFIKLDEELQNKILECSNADDHIIVLNLCSRNKEDPYPDIEPLNIKISAEEKVGGSRIYLMGTNYKLYHIKNSVLCDIEVGESNVKEVEFTIGELGYYVLYYDPRVYNVDFFEDEVEYDDNRNVINEVYFSAIELAQFDNLYFPEIPEKEGYVFTGWKQNIRKGAYDTYCYVEYEKDILLNEWKIYPCDTRNVYASWCSEDEYTPLEVIIDSGKIKKGQEDGQEINLTLSEGMFDETLEEDIENDWKIVGNDELSIANVERIDDTTVKLILAGNSSDKYQTGEIKVEFNSGLYISEEDYNGSMEVHEIADIQLDENGIKKAMFISDNSITLEKQKRSTGGSSKPSSYTVEFNSNGGEVIENVKVERNGVVTEPKVPVREGYVFSGWYTDAELTKKYDFASKVTEGFTLYAGWEKKTTQDFRDTAIMTPFAIIEKVLKYSIKLSNSIFK